MLLEQIVLDVVARTTARMSIDDLVNMVRIHPDYEGNASPELLKRQIQTIVKSEIQRERRSEPDLKSKLLGFEDKINQSEID